MICVNYIPACHLDLKPTKKVPANKNITLTLTHFLTHNVYLSILYIQVYEVIVIYTNKLPKYHDFTKHLGTSVYSATTSTTLFYYSATISSYSVITFDFSLFITGITCV